MNTNFENFRLKLSKISDTATERSYYPLICDFIQNVRTGTTATPEESLAGENKNIGFPDITVRRQNGDQVGWWEIKLPNDSLSKDSFQIQFSKYKDALENVLFTNLHEWQLWQWDQEGKPQKVSEIIFDLQDYSIGEERKLENFLQKFFEYSPYLARTPKQLALALAKKARFLSKQVEEAIDENDKNTDLTKLMRTFESTLIQDIGIHQFSNMIAETLAYSLFLAFLEKAHRGKSEELSLRTAIDYLPTNVPILAELYSLITKVSKTIPTIFQATQMLLEQLKFSDMEKIYHKLVEHKLGEDPVIQFYEPFLKEYDPKEREARGVYYTPKPIVDFIIRGVDYILREKFGKEKGLADESVHLLDPATGTGTFLMSTIQQIYENVKKENINQGEEMVQKSFNKIVIDHILKHFYGFELLVAPYAVAHLKLTLLLQELGFSFEMTKDDNDSDNDRLKVYLANTLDSPERHGEQGKASTDFGAVAFPAIPDESEKARLVKKGAPILVITGNPPYSSVSTNMGNWIKELVNDYLYIDGKRIEEKSKRNNLQNDYVKFIRFAQWKLSTVKQGVIALVTDNSYLDGRTFRGMRKNLIDAFSEVYILNLHGDSKRKEITEGGLPDKNVFDITQGVAIVFLIKKVGDGLNKVTYLDLFGPSKQSKFDWLVGHDISDINVDLSPNDPNYYLIWVDTKRSEEWDSLISIKDVFPLYGTGVMTNRDNFVVDYDQPRLIERMGDFYNTNISDDEVVQKYQLKENYTWKIPKARTKFRSSEVLGNKVINYNYRPFDQRYLYYDDAVVFNPRKIIAQQFEHANIGLMTAGQISTGSFHHSFVTNLTPDKCSLSLQTRESLVCAPLYIYRQSPSQMMLLGVGGGIRSEANLSPDFIKEISGKLGMEFIESGRGDLDINFGPEDVFYYAYAIFHSPTYRTRYAEQLKIDFPRLPLTSSKELFRNLVAKGNELVNLHLLGENPFDKSKTIFAESEKWNVKIGGQKPENLEDWKVTEVRYEEKDKRVYVNPGQYFEGIEKEVWDIMIGGYQVCEKWLKDRKKAERKLDTDDLKHYMKIVVSLRETIRVMKGIGEAIPEWPIN